MTTPQITIYAIFAVVMILMVWDRWRYDLVAFAGLGERMRPEDLPADTATQMGWIYAGLMVLIGVLAALGLRRYTIDRASHEARLALLGGGEPAHNERS